MAEEQPRRFDFTFRLEHMITLAGIGAGLIGGWYLVDYRLGKAESNLDKQVERMDKQMDRLTTVVIDIVRIDTRIADHDRRITGLERR